MLSVNALQGISINAMATEGCVNETSSAVPSPSQKYDRQIRIWGEHGQAALERASVCMLGSGPTATETLKNLVLPGIGAFTIVDGTSVTSGDAGNNFFVAAQTVDAGGEPINRAAAATRSLLELNDRVEGAYIPEDASGFLLEPETSAAFFKKYSIVIVSQMGTTDPTLRTVAAGCQIAQVPLLVVRSYGLLGSIRIQIPELCVLDAHEESAPADLRLHRPFGSLLEFIDAVDFASIVDTTTAAHVPFIVILVKALAKFRDGEGMKLPKTRAEKDTFKGIVKAMQAESACSDDAENFEEALKYSNLRLCYSDAANVPGNVSTVLDDALADPHASATAPATNGATPGASDLPAPTYLSPRLNGILACNSSSATADAPIEDENSSFWIHAAAVRAFVERNNGELPVAGSVPDMTADTKSYVGLQRLYSAKAEADAAKVHTYATEIAERRGSSCRVDEESVRDFCKRLAGIRVIRYRSVEEEASNPKASAFLETVDMEGAADASNPNSALSYYILLRAADRFHSEHGWYPGQREGSSEDDRRLLQQCIAKVKSEYGGSVAAPGLWSDETEEVLRFANGELHNVASFMGGAASQEVVKILTKQFVPLNNTLMVNFSNLTSASFEA